VTGQAVGRRHGHGGPVTAIPTTSPAVGAYLASVRAALSDLPAEERDELCEDLEQHLVEVAAESDEPLSARLGSPESYAAELRASAGLGAPVAPDREAWAGVPAPASGRSACARRGAHLPGGPAG
jgi:hypothetical protein